MSNASNATPFDGFWMPFTAHGAFASAPRILTSAHGMYYRDDKGNSLLDGCAGLWCVNAGHGRQQIVDAIRDAAATLDYAPSFQISHPYAFKLADRLTDMAPAPLNRVFFSNSGSEAVDTALKIALAYHRLRGEASRTRFIGRERGYHGVGFGGISVGGISGNRKLFGSLLPGVDHLPHTLDLRRNAFSKGQPEHGAEGADALEHIIALHDPSNIAAVIVEPLSGSTGVLPAPKNYLQRLREICTKHNILLIFDEVITGFGRLGAAFAAEKYGVTPDIMTLAKGLTNGTIPMGATLVSDEIYDAFTGGDPASIHFPHGYTYSAHPIACAAALATLDIYEEEKLFARAASLSPEFEAAAHDLRDIPCVRDIRNEGLVVGLELAPLESGKSRAFLVFEQAFRRGLLVRSAGDTIALSPPLIITSDEIKTMFSLLRDIIEATL